MTEENGVEWLVRGFLEALGHECASDDWIERFVTGRGEALPGRAWLLGWGIGDAESVVFDTGDPWAIRGASKALRELDAEISRGSVPGIRPEQVLHVNNGGGVAVVSPLAAQEASASLIRLFIERVRVPCSLVTRAIDDESFGTQIDQLEREIADQRAVKTFDSRADIPFFAQRCQVCGWRAASSLVDGRVGESHLVRTVCSCCEDFIGIGQALADKTKGAVRFEEISDPRGFLGVVALELNHLGQTISGLETPLSYCRFLRAVGKIFTRSCETVRESYGLQGSGRRISEHENCLHTPIGGGASWILVVPAFKAIPLARDFLIEVRDRSRQSAILRELGLKDLGACAGVALGRKDVPVLQLLSESKSLLANARQQLNVTRSLTGDDFGGARSFLDFGGVEQGNRDLVDCHSRFDSKLLLSERPYSLDRLIRFSDRRRHWLRLPLRQLHALRSFATRGPHQLRDYLRYQWTRHEGWRQLALSLSGRQSSEAVDPDSLYDVFVDGRDDHHILEVDDLIELRGLWVEPDELQIDASGTRQAI